jgi:hypothetical protein
MSIRRKSVEEVASDLRKRIRSFDEQTGVPADLFQRVMAPRQSPAGAYGRRAGARLAAAGVAGLVLGIALTVGWMHRPASDGPATTGAAAQTRIVLQVYNAEQPCQPLRTIECGLSLYRDPRNLAPGQVVGRVWHRDNVTAACVVTDGTLVKDEEGVSSTRWYRVETTAGVVGYLPGVRTRNTVEVVACPR